MIKTQLDNNDVVGRKTLHYIPRINENSKHE